PNDTSVGEISVKTGNNARNGGKNSLNRLIRLFAGKKSAQIREILISESAWEEMTCLFAPSLSDTNCLEIHGASLNISSKTECYQLDSNAIVLIREQSR
ncbi:hypothetical protein L8Q70_23430, partial [Enterobacter kobei]|nr:hypothetical protein [Enterobacter kobei]